MNRSKYSRSTRATSVSPAAWPSAACATPSGVASPRSAASRCSNAASGARISSAASSAYSCARAALISSVAGFAAGSPNRSGRKILRSTPLTASTIGTRSAGTRVQFDTDGCEIPILRASSLTPPAARTASSRPASRIDWFKPHSNQSNSKVPPPNNGSIVRGYGECSHFRQCSAVRAQHLGLGRIVLSSTILRRSITIALHKVTRQRVGGGRGPVRFAFILVRRRGRLRTALAGFSRRLKQLWVIARGLVRRLARSLDLTLQFAEGLRHHLFEVISSRNGAEGRHGMRVGEVPGVFRKSDEIADRGICGPRAAKRRTGQFGRYARHQEGADVG